MSLEAIAVNILNCTEHHQNSTMTRAPAESFCLLFSFFFSSFFFFSAFPSSFLVSFCQGTPLQPPCFSLSLRSICDKQLKPFCHETVVPGSVWSISSLWRKDQFTELQTVIASESCKSKYVNMGNNTVKGTGNTRNSVLCKIAIWKTDVMLNHKGFLSVDIVFIPFSSFFSSPYRCWMTSCIE